MDAFVSARVPIEVKKRVSEQLRGIGATQTELVNAAFAYVLATGELPRVKRPGFPGPRTLSPEQSREIERWLHETTFHVSEEAWEEADYKQILAEGRAAEYEALP